MRVAIAGLHTETNTFLAAPTDLATFEEHELLVGDAIVAKFATSLSMIGGFLTACDDAAVDVVPLVYANCSASGTVTDSAFERILADILSALSANGPFDVVLLAQHGAAVAETHLDVDAEVATRVRDLVGPDVILAVGLDLHGNISDRLVRAVDVAVGYLENPHRDAFSRGAECATLALQAARGEIRPVQRLVRLPMVVPILGGWTEGGPMRNTMAAAAGISTKYSLLSYTVFHGFGYADVPQLGSSVLTIADANADAADSAAHEIADDLWEGREALRGSALIPSDAMAIAHHRADDHGPIVLLDVGDNVGGGAPGDSTILLALALELDVPGFVMTLCDERAVRQAVQAGLDSHVEVTLGQTTSNSVGPTVSVAATVTCITNGEFEDPNPTHGGVRFYASGPTVRITTPADQDLVITTRAIPPVSPEQLRAVGIEPRDKRVIVAKGVVAPRGGYEPFTREFLLVDTPGVTAASLSDFMYRRRPKPLWPLEDTAAPGSHAGESDITA